MKKIVVITYNYPHRKTQDVVFGLKANNYQEVTLLALPFVFRENPFKPIYSHRPADCYQIYPKELAESFGYNYREVTVDEISKALDEIKPFATLIAGAGILPKDLVNKHKLINSHPAYLPEVRGLDALKWAIFYKNKIGVTSHIVDENADAGWMIDRKEIPIYKEDTFHSIAYRQYRTEIDMLIDSIKKIEENREFIQLEKKGKVNKRMPKKIENNLLHYLDLYKETIC